MLRASHKLRHAGVPFTTYGPGGEKPLSEARALHPLLDFDASAGEGGLPVYGAMHTPTDGIVNPADACQMLVREARSEGVQFSERTRVVELLYDTLDDGCIRVTGVEVEKDGARHVVQCNHSILMACGQWTTPLAAMLPPGPASFFPKSRKLPDGVTVPTAIAPHQYAIFDHLGENDTSGTKGNHLLYIHIYIYI